MKTKPEEKYLSVEHVKAKLQSAKEELRKRYGEAVENIKKDMEENEKAQH
jgi:hypothetical protein